MLQQQQLILLLLLPSHSAHRCAVSLDLRLSQMHFHACILQILLLPHTLTHFSIQLLYCSQLRVAHSALWGKQSAFLCCVLPVSRLNWFSHICCSFSVISLSRAVIAHLDTLLATASTCIKLACSLFSNLNANWGGAHYIWTISFDRQMSLTRW